LVAPRVRGVVAVPIFLIFISRHHAAAIFKGQRYGCTLVSPKKSPLQISISVVFDCGSNIYEFCTAVVVVVPVMTSQYFQVGTFGRVLVTHTIRPLTSSRSFHTQSTHRVSSQFPVVAFPLSESPVALQLLYMIPSVSVVVTV
jgi:hypothetical protein